jgi:hypothetical protein
MSHRRPCRGCGKEIMFVVNQRTGHEVPLDVNSRAHIYELLDAVESGDVATPVSQQEVYVSHFLTCAKANGFKNAQPVQRELL